MARIRVPFKGITSQSNHQDGECKNIVNLRPERGYYRPVTPRKVLQQLSHEYDIVFVHRWNDYENWIGISVSAIYNNIKGARVGIGDVQEKILSVNQIGNTLSFVTANDIFYALWTGTEYKFLGRIPDTPNVSFTTTPYSYTRTYVDEYGTPATQDNIYDLTKGLVESMIDARDDYFSDAFLIRWAFRLYDGSIIKVSSPILVMMQDHYKDLGLASLYRDIGSTTYNSNSNVILKFIKLTASYDFSYLSQWKDIITSIDFFITNHIGLTGSNNVNSAFSYRGTENTEGGFNIYYPSIRGSEDEISPIDKVEAASNFYLYYSESDFTVPKTITFPNAQTTVNNDLSNIIYQELLEDISFSHHRYGSHRATVLNNRLRLSGIKTSFFAGFPVTHFSWGSTYNGASVPASGGLIGLFTLVHLNTENGEKILFMTTNGYVLFMNAFISYPDSRATKIRFFTHTADGYYHEKLSVQLKPHPALNIAYAINNDLLPYIGNIDIISGGMPYYTPIANLTELNKIKVSEVNNPFIFPNALTYQIGVGEILNESSVIMNVSDRNYGTQESYVFTTDGVYTLPPPTPDTVHSNVNPPTHQEPPISGVVGQTPYGVVFITNRGLMQINNNGASFLSRALREDDDVLNIDLTGVTDSMATYPTASFREFLKTVSSIVYNPYEDELIFSASGYPYNYVYDYETKSFYLSTNLIEQMVQNVFPDIFYINGLNLLDFSQSQNKSAHVSILTRPIQFESPDIKKLERIFLRAVMYNANQVSVAAYHSIDGVNFTPIKGFVFGAGGNYKDFDLGLLARETYRQYLFLLTGTMDEESRIEYVEFEVDKSYGDEKMR